MTPDIDEDARQRIAAFLPDALMRALNSYMAHVPAKPSGDNMTGKNFEEYHKGAKAALAHIELLYKLARLLRLPDAKIDDGSNQIILAAMMQQAEEDLARYREGKG